MTRSRIALLAAVAVLAGLFFALDLARFFDLAYLKAQQGRFSAYYLEHRASTLAAFFLVYVAVTALSLPGAAVMTLAAGALFGLVTGTVLVSFASSIGATLAFLMARYLLRDTVQKRFSSRLEAINRGMERDGALYLFTLRLVPLFPFFVINLVMGLTNLKTLTFFLVSQVGMLAGTIVFVNAGTQLADIEAVGDVLSPGLIASFVLLGVFPLLARWFVDMLNRRKALARFQRPAHFDRNLIVVGAGSAGLVSAYIAAAVKASVTLIERERMGGDCLNTGCVPSKALLRSAKLAHDTQRARALGFQSATVEPDFRATMQRVQRVIAAIEPHDSVERYSALGVDCVAGHARLVSPWEVEVDGRRLSARNIIIATGGRPFVPPIPGIEAITPLTSDSIWSLEALPQRLVVLGGGPIGSELAQAFNRLGASVTQIEMAPRLLMKEDPEFSTMLYERFVAEGMDVRLEHKAVAIERDGGDKRIVCENAAGETVRIEFDELLVAVGRRANTADLGLEELGITLNADGTVETDDYLRTRMPTVFTCGDVAGPYQFTHTAAHQAWYAAVNALFGQFRKFRVDYSVIPWATFTDPEIARVGLSEGEARERGIDFDVTSYPVDDLDRAIADEAAEGLVKVVTAKGSDRILGVTIAGQHAGDIIAEYVLAMKHGIGLNKILGTIHIYPTMAEANKYVAGNWKRANAPQGLLNWVARYHAWRRGGGAGSSGGNSAQAAPGQEPAD